MTLHAGFAAALSIHRGVLQTFVHAAHLDDVIPTSFTGSTGDIPNLGNLRYSLFLAEPELVLEANPRSWLKLRSELAGDLIATLAGTPATWKLVVRMELVAPVVLVKDEAGQWRFGVNFSVAECPMFEASIGGGLRLRDIVSPGTPPPEDAIQAAILSRLHAMKPEEFLISPGLLQDFVSGIL